MFRGHLLRHTAAVSAKTSNRFHRLFLHNSTASSQDTMPNKRPSYYAVRVGRQPGIYTSWAECRNEVSGYSGNEYKGFSTIQEAQEYMGTHAAGTSGPQYARRSAGPPLPAQETLERDSLDEPEVVGVIPAPRRARRTGVPVCAEEFKRSGVRKVSHALTLDPNHVYRLVRVLKRRGADLSWSTTA